MKILGNKKAAERYMSPWLFLVWALIFVAIVAGVLIFYSAEGDVREIESEILAVRIVDCVVDSSYLNENFLSEDFDIFKECFLNKEILDDSREFYFNVSVTGEKISKEITAGEKDFEIQCELEGRYFAKCSRRKVYILNKENEKLNVEVLAGSIQLGSRI